MKRFARLLDQLSYQSQRNAKLRLVADYFATAPDPDRWLYARRPHRAISSSAILSRALPRARGCRIADPMLFGLSYD